MYDEKIHSSKGVKEMHRKIIAGVMSTLICATALTPDTGVLATQYSAEKTGTVENEKIEGSDFTDELSLYDQADVQKTADEAANAEVSETPVVTTGSETGSDAEAVTETPTALVAAVPADEDIIETAALGDNITGYIYSNGLLRIHGYGDMNDFGNSPFKNISSVTQILFENEDANNGKKITTIGAHVFYRLDKLSCSSCDDITKAEAGVIQIPDSVTSIGEGAFYECAAIKEVKLNSALENIGKYAFGRCRGLTSFTVPESVTAMGINMLSECTELKTLTLPYAATKKIYADGEEPVDGYSSVSDLFVDHGRVENAEGLFDDYSLSKIIITGGKIIPDYAFANISSVKEIDLSSTKASSIGSYAFYHCISLSDVKINDSIESVGNNAYSLTLIKALPDNGKIKTIGSGTFEGCKNLSDITIPESYESIGKYAFKDCTGITELVIPENITSMGIAIFNGCKELKTLTLPFAATLKESAEPNGTIDGYSSVSDLFFDHGALQNDPAQFEGYSIAEITITSGTKIPDFAFAGMPTLKKVDFSGTKTLVIGENAFFNCTSLENILMPDTVTTIKKAAFCNCSSVRDFELSKKLESIEAEAFYNCTGLSTLTIPDTVTSMGVNMFGKCFNIKSLQLPYAATLKSCTDTEGTVDGYSSVSDLFIAHGHGENDPKQFEGYSVSKITITGGDKIPAYAFAGMSTLKEIDLSKSQAASIGDYAFYNCTVLDNVILNDKIESVGNYAYAHTAVKALPDTKKIKDLGANVFEDCKGLTDITIPESYQSIGRSAFKDDTGITELVIPENVTSLGIGMFEGCTELKTLTLPYAATSKEIAGTEGNIDGYTSVSDLFFIHGHAENDIKQFNGYKFTKLTITGGDKIPAYAFAGIPTLKEIDLSKTEVNEIGEYAFYNCTGINSIELPKSVKTVKKGAFQNCTGLSEIKLNNGLETIEREAFTFCTGLHTLTVPDSVTSMGVGMLSECTSLEELIIPYAATQKSCTDAEGAIDGYSSVSDLFVIHGHVENDHKDFNKYSVSKIVVTGGEKIPSYAFAGFSSLTDIDLSSTKVDSIGEGAFYNCSSAENITLPETVTSVDKGAFSNSNADIYIYNPKCNVSDKAFDDNYSGTIHGLTESSIKTLSDDKAYKFDALDDEIIIGPVNITLQTGETYKINSNKKDLKFTSSDAEVVSVSDDGILTAGKEGKASVEVKAAEDQSSSMNIWVRNPFVTEAPAVTEPAVTTTEAVTTSVTETEASETTPAEAVTTTVVETVPTTVTTTEPVTTTAETTVTSTEPVTTTAETTVTTETTTEAVTTAAETTVTTVTSTEAVTTAVETTVTTVSSTEAVTTAAETTAASETEPAVTDSDPSDTDIEDPTDRILFNITSLEEFSEWAKVDYSIRTGKPAAEAVVIPVTAKYYKIEIKDENGNILDTYSINPKIGIGTTSNNEVVNLPQTGNNSRKNLFTAFAALLMTVLGAAAMKFSGIFDRRRKSDK